MKHFYSQRVVDGRNKVLTDMKNRVPVNSFKMAYKWHSSENWRQPRRKSWLEEGWGAMSSWSQQYLVSERSQWDQRDSTYKGKWLYLTSKTALVTRGTRSSASFSPPSNSATTTSRLVQVNTALHIQNLISGSSSKHIRIHPTYLHKQKTIKQCFGSALVPDPAFSVKADLDPDPNPTLRHPTPPPPPAGLSRWTQRWQNSKFNFGKQLQAYWKQ